MKIAIYQGRKMCYFTNGVILGLAEFVRGFTGAWQREKGRKLSAESQFNAQGANWGDLAVIQSLRRQKCLGSCNLFS